MRMTLKVIGAFSWSEWSSRANLTWGLALGPTSRNGICRDGFYEHRLGLAHRCGRSYRSNDYAVTQIRATLLGRRT